MAGKKISPWKEQCGTVLGGSGCQGRGEAGREVLWGQRGLGVGPGQKATMSQATDAQPRRSVKLAKSWEPGRGTTLTEDVQLGGIKKITPKNQQQQGQGQLIGIVFVKETE